MLVKTKFAQWSRSVALLLLLWLLAFAPPTAQALSRQHGRGASIMRQTKVDRDHKRMPQVLRASRKVSPSKAARAAALPLTMATPVAPEAPVVATKQNRADRMATSLRAMAARAASPRRAARLGRWADTLQYLFGYETMDTASLELSAAVTLKIPGWAALGNIALQVRKWFPSREYRREAAQKGWKEPTWGYAAGPATPWAGSYGYDSVLGWYMPGISTRGYGQGIGIPNFASVGFGYVGATKPTEYARGTFVSATAQVFSIGILGIAIDVNAYYRPAIVVTRYMKPIADKLRLVVKRVASFFTGKPPSPPEDADEAVPPTEPSVEAASPRVSSR